MTDGPEVNAEYCNRVAELVKLIERLPADRQEQLRAGTGESPPNTRLIGAITCGAGPEGGEQ